jgi:transcriptional regulator with XRE-family HTH domain
MSDYGYIGKHIRNLRKSNKITQKELASQIGKAESSIQKYEAGKVHIPMDVLEEIAKVLNVDVFVLIAKNFKVLKEDAENEIKKDAQNMLYMVGYETTELESGDYEIIGKYGSITASRKEFDELYIGFLDYISYAANKFYNQKREEKSNK